MRARWLAFGAEQLDIELESLRSTPTRNEGLDPMSQVLAVFDQEGTCLSLNLVGQSNSEPDYAILSRADRWQITEFY